MCSAASVLSNSIFSFLNVIVYFVSQLFFHKMKEKRRLQKQGRLWSKKFRLMIKVGQECDETEVRMLGAAHLEDHLEGK